MVPLIPPRARCPYVDPDEPRSIVVLAQRALEGGHAARRRGRDHAAPARGAGADDHARAADDLPDARHRLLNPEWGHASGRASSPSAAKTGSWRMSTRWTRATSTSSRSAWRAWVSGSGVGVLEQLVLGPHVPSGFQSILDGAADGATSSGR